MTVSMSDRYQSLLLVHNNKRVEIGFMKDPSKYVKPLSIDELVEIKELIDDAVDEFIEPYKEDMMNAHEDAINTDYSKVPSVHELKKELEENTKWKPEDSRSCDVCVTCSQYKKTHNGKCAAESKWGFLE